MWKKLFFSKIFILVEIILLVFAAMSLFKILEKKQAREQEINKLKEEFLTLKQQNSDFLAKVKEINSESYVELEAKKRLNFKKAGEKVIVFVKDFPNSDNEQADIITENVNIINDSSNNLILWWRYFFNQ